MRTLNLENKIIILFWAAMLALAFSLTSCGSTRSGCPATSGFSGYHSR